MFTGIGERIWTPGVTQLAWRRSWGKGVARRYASGTPLDLLLVSFPQLRVCCLPAASYAAPAVGYSATDSWRWIMLLALAAETGRWD